MKTMDSRINKPIKCCRMCIHYEGKWMFNAVPMMCSYWKENTLDYDCCYGFKQVKLKEGDYNAQSTN